MVNDSHPGAQGSNWGRWFVEVAGSVFFVANEPGTGRELWNVPAG